MHPNLQTLCLNVYQYHFSKFYQLLITLYKIKNPFSVGRMDCYDALSYHIIPRMTDNVCCETPR